MHSVSINIGTAASNILPVYMVPRGLSMGDGYGDTVATFLERVENATIDVAAKILGHPETSISRNTRYYMSLSIRFGGIGVGTWLPWRMRPDVHYPRTGGKGQRHAGMQTPSCGHSCPITMNESPPPSCHGIDEQPPNSPNGQPTQPV
jgi:hypothetical protein